MAVRPFKRRGMLDEGAVIIPTRVMVSFRYISGQSGASVKVYGIIRNQGASGSTTNYNPVLLNSSGAGETIDDTAGAKECSQFFKLNSEYMITSVVVLIDGIEKLARVREIILFGKTDEFANEQEYVLE